MSLVQGQCHFGKMGFLDFGTLNLFAMTYGINIIMKIKVISRSKSFEVKVIPESHCKCLDFYPEEGSWLLTECILVCPWSHNKSILLFHAG